MPKWIVILEDRPTEEARSVRKDSSPEHFDFLTRNFDWIVFSCGLKTRAGADGAAVPFGGLWMVEAENREEVVALYEADPYFSLGLRGRIEVYEAHEGYV